MYEEACKPPQALLNGCLTFTRQRRRQKLICVAENKTVLHWNQHMLQYLSRADFCSFLPRCFKKQGACILHKLPSSFPLSHFHIASDSATASAADKMKTCIVRLWRVIFIYWNIRHLQTVFKFSETFWNIVSGGWLSTCQMSMSAEVIRVKMFWLVPAFWALLACVVNK